MPLFATLNPMPMRSLPALVAAALVLAAPVGCGTKEDSAPAEAKPSPASAPQPTPPAGAASASPAQPDPHGPGGPMAEKPRVTRTAEGTIELTIDGTPQSIDFLPYGRNAAVWVEKTGASHVTIGGSETDTGFPTLSITLTGVKLDDVALPVTISGGGKAGSPAARITWQVGEKRIYRTREPAAEAKPKHEVVLQSYADGRLKGTFQGELVMGTGELDPPISARGTFDVSLRLNGVAPNRAGT